MKKAVNKQLKDFFVVDQRKSFKVTFQQEQKKDAKEVKLDEKRYTTAVYVFIQVGFLNFIHSVVWQQKSNNKEGEEEEVTNISRGGSNSEDREEKQFIALQVSQIHFFLTKCAVDLARDNKGNDVAATVAKDYNL